MASTKSLVELVVERAAGAGDVRAKAMFGEYGIYCGDRMVALFCDDTLFVKPTEGGRALVGDAEMGHPYPQGKPCFIIDEGRWDDEEWLAALFKVTAAELPAPKAKRKKAKN